MKIGLFFGSFDPIHNGHLLKAVEALEKKLVDRVVFVPAKQNPWKPEPMFDYEKRVYMCSVAAHSLRFAMVGKDDGKILVSDIEGQMNGTAYTYDVLCKFKDEHPFEDICLICGTDVSLDIPKWKDGEKLLKEFEVITLNRGTDDESDYPDLNISSTKIRELIKKKTCQSQDWFRQKSVNICIYKQEICKDFIDKIKEIQEEKYDKEKCRFFKKYLDK